MCIITSMEDKVLMRRYVLLIPPLFLLSQMNVISHEKSTRYRAYVMGIVLRMGLILDQYMMKR